MKHITKLAFLGAITTFFGAAVAFADDSQLQNRLSLQRIQNLEASRSSTVAVYSSRKGASPAKQYERPAVEFAMLENAHGQEFDEYVPKN
jgi:hypothetical protein